MEKAGQGAGGGTGGPRMFLRNQLPPDAVPGPPAAPRTPRQAAVRCEPEPEPDHVFVATGPARSSDGLVLPELSDLPRSAMSAYEAERERLRQRQGGSPKMDGGACLTNSTAAGAPVLGIGLPQAKGASPVSSLLSFGATSAAEPGSPPSTRYRPSPVPHERRSPPSPRSSSSSRPVSRYGEHSPRMKLATMGRTRSVDTMHGVVQMAWKDQSPPAGAALVGGISAAAAAPAAAAVPTPPDARPRAPATLGTTKLKEMRGNRMSMSAPELRRITFAVEEKVVESFEVSDDERQEKREWSRESKKTRMIHRAQVQGEKARARRKKHQDLGKHFGTAAMPDFLVPRSVSPTGSTSSSTSSDAGLDDGDDRRTVANMRIGALVKRTSWDETESDEGIATSEDEDDADLRAMAVAAAREHSPTAPRRPPVIGAANSPTPLSPRMHKSILKPEPHVHNWQRSTIWAGGIPEQLAVERTIMFLFRTFGPVRTVTIRLKTTGPCKSWAFVTFSEPHGAARARLAGELRVDRAELQVLCRGDVDWAPADGVLMHLKETSVPTELQKESTGALAAKWAEQEQKLLAIAEAAGDDGGDEEEEEEEDDDDDDDDEPVLEGRPEPEPHEEEEDGDGEQHDELAEAAVFVPLSTITGEGADDGEEDGDDT